MHKYFISIGAAWLAFALILGLVLALQPLLRKNQGTGNSSGGTIINYIRGGGGSGVPDNATVKTEATVGIPPVGGKDVGTSANISGKK